MQLACCDEYLLHLNVYIKQVEEMRTVLDLPKTILEEFNKEQSMKKMFSVLQL